MDIGRISRYKDKLNIISERKQDIEEWVSGYDSSDFIEDKKTRLAVYKAFQELVEASFDVVALACKDLKTIPKDDYTNIDLLFEKKFINSSLKNTVSILDFSEVIEKWLRSNL